MSGQRRPYGPIWQTGRDWKTRVRLEMERQGISRAEMSRRVGVSDAAITQLFDGTQSKLVPKINRVLGLTPPYQSSGDYNPELVELIEIMDQLEPADREEVIRYALGTARIVARKK